MKIISIVRHGGFLVFPILALLLVFSCSDPQSPPVKKELDRSAGNLLLAFAKSYKEMELAGYDDCLDEDFRFIFTPQVADSLSLPPDEAWWGKTEEIACAGNMFEDPVVLKVTFSYETLGDWIPTQEVREDTVFAGLFRRLDPLIEVTVSAGSEYDPMLKFLVDESWLDVIVVPDRFTEGLWCILSIQEVEKNPLGAPLVSAGAATGRSTWGIIKATWAGE